MLGLSVSISGLLLGGRFVSVCSANQLAQHLALNIGVFVDKARERFGIHGQPIAPLLDPILLRMFEQDPSQGFRSMADLWGAGNVSKITIGQLLNMTSGIVSQQRDRALA